MRVAFLGVFLGALVGCSTSRIASPTTAPTQQAIRPDPIGVLVARLSTTDASWKRGLFPEIDLPATASPRQVVKEVFRRTFFGTKLVARYQVLETRRMPIDDPGTP